jgi:hypothetical protein
LTLMIGPLAIEDRDPCKQVGIFDMRDSTVTNGSRRYDLLCIEGISRALRAFLKKDLAPTYALKHPAGGEADLLTVHVSNEVKSISSIDYCGADLCSSASRRRKFARSSPLLSSGTSASHLGHMRLSSISRTNSIRIFVADVSLWQLAHTTWILSKAPSAMKLVHRRTSSSSLSTRTRNSPQKNLCWRTR